jgi:N-acetylglutamate synthase-like GNAT family acetyltransferase
MGEIEIRPFVASDIDGVFSVILPIQREEFGIAITADDQPDLALIPDFYQFAKGQFWVAVRDEEVVGTLGLKEVGNGQTALRKMFVAAGFRRREHSVATRLLAQLIAHAQARGVRDIFLGTTDKFVAAHHFYEKNGFAEVAKADLPQSFPLMAVDTKFYQRTISAAQG